MGCIQVGLAVHPPERHRGCAFGDLDGEGRSVGYASSSDGPVHFGLGPDARADFIEIHWPSGMVQTLRNVAADRVIKVKEP